MTLSICLPSRDQARASSSGRCTGAFQGAARVVMADWMVGPGAYLAKLEWTEHV